MKRISALLVLGAFGFVTARPLQAAELTALEQASLDQQMSIAVEGAKAFSIDTPHISWSALYPEVYANMIEGAFSGPDLPGCMSYKVITYGEGDFEMWLSMAGMPAFYYYSVDPTGTYDADVSSPENLPTLEDAQARALISALAEIWFRPEVLENQSMVNVPAMIQATKDQMEDTAIRVAKQACLVASIASGGAAKAGSEQIMTGRLRMGKVSAGGLGALVAVAVFSLVDTACKSMIGVD